jgi:lipopolysaccharide export system permease protein
MKALDRFVLKHFLGPFTLSFVLVMFVLLMQFLWKWVDVLVGKGLDWTVIAELMTYIGISLMPLALPLAMLLSTLMAMGNMGENNETLALKAAGVSLVRIMTPLFFAVGLFTVGAFFLSNNVVPYVNLKAYSLLYDVQQKRPELQIREGVFYNGIPNISLKIGAKDEKTNLLKRILIYNHKQSNGNIDVTYADSGYMKITDDQRYLVVTLYNGNMYQEVQGSTNPQAYELKPFRHTYFAKQQIIVEINNYKFDRTNESLFKDSERMQNINQLVKSRDSLDKQRQYKVNMYLSGLVHTGYYRKASEIDTTIKTKKLEKLVAFESDSIYQAFDNQKKMQTIDNALSNAQSAQQYITANSWDLQTNTEQINRMGVEMNKKFTLSLAALLFFFIGAPLGAIIRKGGFGMPIVVSVLFFIAYYILSITGEKFAREGVWSIFAGTWFSSFILLVIGIFLSYKSMNESQILSLDAYAQFFKRILRIKRGR